MCKNNNGISFIVRILTRDKIIEKALEALRSATRPTKERINDHVDKLAWEHFVRSTQR